MPLGACNKHKLGHGTHLSAGCLPAGEPGVKGGCTSSQNFGEHHVFGEFSQAEPLETGFSGCPFLPTHSNSLSLFSLLSFPPSLAPLTIILGYFSSLFLFFIFSAPLAPLLSPPPSLLPSPPPSSPSIQDTLPLFHLPLPPPPAPYVCFHLLLSLFSPPFPAHPFSPSHFSFSSATSFFSVNSPLLTAPFLLLPLHPPFPLSSLPRDSLWPPWGGPSPSLVCQASFIALKSHC